MHDAPLAVDLAHPHGQTKFQRFPGAVWSNVDALPRGGCKGNILPARNLHVVKLEGDGLLARGKERLPGRHVGIQASRRKGRRHIEHQDVHVMIIADGRSVFVADGFAPSLDQSVYLRLIVRWVLRHALPR